MIIVVGIVVSNGASSIRASSRSDLKVGEVVVIGVDNFHHWVGVLAVAIHWVQVCVLYLSASLTCLSSFEDAEGKDEGEGGEKNRTKYCSYYLKE